MILVLDNYDSFVYNLVQYLGEMGVALEVHRNDKLTIDAIRGLSPSAILLSPGPGVPTRAGICIELVQALGNEFPILGICLGHQVIGEAYGAEVTRADRVIHGKTSLIHHDGQTIFENIASPFPATRYHSLLVSRRGLPDCLEVSAWTDDGLIMGLRHKELPVEGVQFHPESILTCEGPRLLANFANRCRPNESDGELHPPAAPVRLS
ncbi:MAG: aminodeoxychorismate/anthranilate synthase component II [Phycisphaerae bacterium]|jgi:anthranilate synthase/aminodeoxychorismate synthase-like glutamine amidotransferase